MRTRLAPAIAFVSGLRRSRRARSLITVSLAIVAGSVTIGALASSAATRNTYGEQQSMPVARHDLEVGHVIDERDVVWRTLPIALTAGSTVAEPVGRTVIEPVVGGEVLLTRRLSGSTDLGRAGAIPRTSRAISLERTELTPPLQPGDEVDLLTASSRSGAAAIARRARVLEVSDRAIVVIVAESETSAVARAALDATVLIALRGQE